MCRKNHTVRWAKLPLPPRSGSTDVCPTAILSAAFALLLAREAAAVTAQRVVPLPRVPNQPAGEEHAAQHVHDPFRE